MMSKSKMFIFIVLHIIAWIIFVGLSIEAGGLIVNFFFNIFKPEMVSRLYLKLDMSQMYARSTAAFYSMYSFMIILAVLKALLFYKLVELKWKLDLNNPFTTSVSKHVTNLSYFTFAIGIIGYIARQTAEQLMHRGYKVQELYQFWPDSEAFILMAAVIFTIATIFSRGVELQTENDLTV
jgi:hypothetical protein